MTDQLFALGERTMTASDSGWQAALAAARRSGLRPRCMCTAAGVEMYIASTGDHLIVKRMPLSGAAHAPGCDSFTPPPELSGLGPLLGAAIEDDGEYTKLKLAFALSFTGAAAAPASSSEPGDSVGSDPARLSMRGTAHYLWEQAGFNRWVPAMVGKRSWSVVRAHLLGAARDKTAKGRRLSESLYLPEAHSPEGKAEIAARHTKAMRTISPDTSGGRKRMMLLLGEVATITEGRIGHRLTLNELPDFPILLSEDLYGRMRKRFDTEFELWAADEHTRLIATATISANRSGVPSVHELTLMTVTANWIPYESLAEKLLLDHLTDRRRSFVKSLRYNLPDSRALAFAVLTDTDPATALYLADGEQQRGAIDALIAESELPSWVWDVAAELPALPSPITLPAKGTTPTAGAPDDTQLAAR